jgi:Mn2+/Fe2+ NRAMP family transporter
MTLRVLLSTLIASITLALMYYLCPDLGLVPDYYAKNIRGSLFTGFLTVGSFLLSLKAFIVVKLKENIFDSDIYKERLKQQRKLNSNLTLYGPVKRLSQLIFLTICSALTASVSQLTIGLIQHWLATFFCIFVSMLAISMLVSTLLLIKSTLDEWLNYLEEANDSKA